MRYKNFSRVFKTLAIFQVFFFILVGFSTPPKANISGLTETTEAQMGGPPLASSSNRTTDFLVYLPSISKPAKVVPIANGDFEQGPTVWIEYSFLGEPIILDDTELIVEPHGGSWAAWLGGLFDEDSYIEQTVTIPTDATYLTYWHWIDSLDSCGNDIASVKINHTTIIDEYDLCVGMNTGGWVGHSVDMSAYAGQTVALQIRVVTNGSGPSSLFVDDVTFRSTPLAVTVIQDFPIAPGSVSTKPISLSPGEKNK